MGIKNFLGSMLSFGGDRDRRRYERIVEIANGYEAAVQGLSDNDFKLAVKDFKSSAINDESLGYGCALAREASWRTLKKRSYDVQLIGALALMDGHVAEMPTGSGKTVTAPIACFLVWALEGKSSHVVTVNEYLTARDSEIVRPMLEYLGMTVGLTQYNGELSDKIAAYQCDVTYGTATTLGFDYLRDNMAKRVVDQCQGPHEFVIIDEVDSILIDEARTPLIISGPGNADTDDLMQMAEAVRGLVAGVDFDRDRGKNICALGEDGLNKVENRLGMHGIYEEGGAHAAMLNQAMRAEHMMRRDVDYIVRNGEVLIVDEFTGRVMDGRRFSDGLHQAIEAKEGLEIKPENTTIATVTLQNYFRSYEKIAGMSGTALTEDLEFSEIYGMSVFVVPPHKPCIREDLPDKIFATEDAKFRAVVAEIKAIHETGAPVLVGTVSVDKSERLSKMLTSAGIVHNVLNAKNDAEEAAIIAQAGRVGAVTVATNMAGRGTDILLGGNIEDLLVDVSDLTERQHLISMVECDGITVRKLGGLHVIGTERHESKRIDNQLRGRAGRQGDPGQTQFYLSLEDDVVAKYAEENVLESAQKLFKGDHGVSVESPALTKLMDMSQSAVQYNHTQQRKRTLDFDDVMNHQRIAWYKQRQEVLATGQVDLEALADTVACGIADVSDNYDQDVQELLSIKASGIEDAEDIKTLILRGCDTLKKSCPSEQFFDMLIQKGLLAAMDTEWVDHLDEMAHVKQGIGLRAYGHKDPVMEYKDEAYKAFEVLYFNTLCSFFKMVMETEIVMPDVSHGECVVNETKHIKLNVA